MFRRDGIGAHHSPSFTPGLGHGISVSGAPRVSTVLQPEGKDHLRTVTGDKPKLESQLYRLPTSNKTPCSPRLGLLICTWETLPLHRRCKDHRSRGADQSRCPHPVPEALGLSLDSAPWAVVGGAPVPAPLPSRPLTCGSVSCPGAQASFSLPALHVFASWQAHC